MSKESESLFDARFAPLESGYVIHAAPEAIEARLKKASRREREAAREVNALLALLRHRIEQKEAGLWP